MLMTMCQMSMWDRVMLRSKWLSHLNYCLETPSPSEILRKWFLVIDVATLSRKWDSLPVEKLSSFLANSRVRRTLYGFIVFELAWKDACDGYFTCYRRCEFDSTVEATKGTAAWFPGTLRQRFLLEDQLDSTLVRLIGKVQVGTVFMSKGDNEVPFEFKTEGGSLLEQAVDELDRGVKTRKKGEVAMITSIGSAATLVALQCVEVAEAMIKKLSGCAEKKGKEREQKHICVLEFYFNKKGKESEGKGKKI
ncbi:hypothetical protein Tco_1347747 [Tanacetum coccineum]